MASDQPRPGEDAANELRPSPGRSYTPDEWTDMKPLIKSLYLDEKWTLPKVMKELARSHDFKPTIKMYKNQIEKWGFHKNITKPRLRDPRKLPGGLSDRRLAKYKRRTQQSLPSSPTVDDSSPAESDSYPSTASAPEGGAGRHGVYEDSCPYGAFTKLFRYEEHYEDGAVYRADSHGYRAYIDLDEERPCSDQCPCRSYSQSLGPDHIFTVSKSNDQLCLTIWSTGLLAEIRQCVHDADLDLVDDSVDGLVLLRHHAELKRHMLRLAGISLSPIVVELRLLIDGLLGDSQVFRSFGYEDLHERGCLDHQLWCIFQQQRFDNDLGDLDDLFRSGHDDEPWFCSQLQVETPIMDTTATTDSSEALKMAPAAIEEPEQRYVTRIWQIGRFVPSEWSHYVWRDSLSDAARSGNLEAVQRQLRPGVLEDSGRLLYSAATGGNVKVLKLLVEHGARGREVDALEVAVNSGNTEMADVILRSSTDGYETPFLVSVAFANLSAMKTWVSKTVDVNATSRAGTALNIAMRLGHDEIVRSLVGYGADVQLAALYEQRVDDWFGQSCQMFMKNISRICDCRTQQQPSQGLLHLRWQFRKQCRRIFMVKDSMLRSLKPELHRPALTWTFRNAHSAWNVGMRTLRDLSAGKDPHDMCALIALLAVVRALVETIKSRKGFDFTEDFDGDLDRWTDFFGDPFDRKAFRYVAFEVWNVRPTSSWEGRFSRRDRSLSSSQALVRSLVERARDVLDLDLSNGDRLDQSQRRWRKRNQLDVDSEPCPPADGPSAPEQSLASPDPPPLPPPKPPDPRLLRRAEKSDLTPAMICVLTGAIFCIIIAFLQELRRRTLEFAEPGSIRKRVDTVEARRSILMEYLGTTEEHCTVLSLMTMSTFS